MSTAEEWESGGDIAFVPFDPPANDPLPDEPRSELGYARRLIHVHGDHLRYVPAWKRWLVWDGTRWAPDSTGQPARWAKEIARRVYADALLLADDKDRKAVVSVVRRGESSAAVAGALTLAGTEPGIALSPEALDADPWLLNCRNGVLDLRTRQLGPHDPAQHLTKVTGADYDPGAGAPEFTKFLERIQPDPEMRAFLARLLGHALPGTVLEHLLPIFQGAGANGKSTLLDHAVCPALGDYASTAEAGIFTERGFDAHPTGVADLFGRRLVVVHESDRGRHLAEGTVKRLTGGDRIKARRMREDFWEFAPSHTALMLTNHRPLVRGTDEGIWRRLRLVPFDVVIPAAERDHDLGERLRLELAGVLAWLVAGYTDWRGNGLADPEQVTGATAGWRDESDALGTFLEGCLLGARYSAPSAQLYAAWCSWCDHEGESPGTQKSFSTALQSKGYDNRRTRTGAIWAGIGLPTPESQNDDWRQSQMSDA